MYKYKLQQAFGVTEETGVPIKEFNMNTFLNVEGVSQHRVMDMLNQCSYGFASLMDMETQSAEKGFAELNKKLMQEGGEW